MKITTKRLIIRPFKQTDMDDVYEIYSSEETCKYLLFEPWCESNKDEKFKRKITNNKLTKETPIFLACEFNDKVIGDISIWYTEMKNTVEIGYAFHHDFTGNGYASEALRNIVEYLFNTQKIHRIQAVLDARNISSAKLCKRIGMRQEAHFIDDYWNKGEWTSSFVYGMLKTDLDSCI